MCLPLVKGPKVMGQLASQLFHGQVCVIPSLSQLQWADKRSRVHFKCAICIWNLLLSTVKMRSKELSLSVKQAIIRLKKQNKPIREIAKTLGVAKTTVWNILKKKERTGELSNTKRPGRPWKTTVVDDRRILSLVKKSSRVEVAVEAWQSITRDETQRLVMSMRSRLQAVIDCKGFATKY